ncbi:hypothetical protein TrRE_jg6839 [Triparma retinervis]|uniref:Uncharacterized protein n=1 Tax=Triparma retinervis TaxID=2557542 RepID=A0A9W7A855_9STRA|nr:hypothetical protein TrRE_jg6839 [Triparma retinervis]
MVRLQGGYDPAKPIGMDNYDKTHGEYDITPWNCEMCVTMKHKIALGNDETTRIFVNEGCCGEKSNEVRSRPYAQLGSVDVSMYNNCCCCGAEVWMVSTDGGDIAPAGNTGNCCNPTDKKMVEEISEKLQELKVARGNIGLMKMHNANGDKLAHVANMLDALASAKGVDAPPCSTVMDRTDFPNVTYDVQNWQEVPLCCRGKESYASKLHLEEFEIKFTNRTPCYQTNSRRPYAQLGVVAEQDVEVPCAYDCCSCEPVGGHAVEVDGVRVQPRLGMETELCQTIAMELQARKVALGNIGQLQKGEQIRDVVNHAETSLEAIMQKLGVQVPSKPE